MPSWKGDTTNPAPNIMQETPNRSELDKIINRSYMVRRDTDEQKNFTVTLMDVDTVIKEHLDKMRLQVVDDGNQIMVPIFYGSPENWTSVRRDGFMRDRQGEILRPALIFKRTSSESDPSMMMFNRYLRYPIMKKNSSKNRYTRFSQLVGQNTPVHEIYEVVAPDHMLLTYQFIVWTDYQVQMNLIVERIKFDTEDYWFDTRGFKFRTRIESFNHTTEVQMGEDRVVKTEFNLQCNAYLLPDLYDGKKPTTVKSFTPKKVIMGAEIVESDFDMDSVKPTSKWSEWKSKKYPNLDQKDEPEGPPIVWGGDVSDGSAVSMQTVIDSINSIRLGSSESSADGAATITWHSVPDSPAADGQEGWMAYDASYVYIYSHGQWRRVPISLFG